ncbi:hypothetical protein CCACVL1_18170 [Corchorus capsularis]|uniref:Uncharacterized protein n=1 Tax=Corchorus capsularis TaxID=210143 RepID=A0A1R3HMG2_COCAP|nr:hypothetical protein CCACVL1_18170 [Corchorus capsularis]
MGKIKQRKRKRKGPTLHSKEEREEEEQKVIIIIIITQNPQFESYPKLLESKLVIESKTKIT